MSISLAPLLKRLYHHYRPYFGFRKNKKWRSLMAAAILFNSVLAACCMTLINASINVLMDVLSLPVITYGAYFGALGYFFGAILTHALIMYTNFRIGSKLSDSLSHAIKKKFFKKWANSRAFLGIKLMSNQNALHDPAKVMAHDHAMLDSKILSLIISFLMVAGNFIVGAVGLYAMSVPLTVTLFSTTITIPAYLLISTLAYGLIYNAVTTQVGKTLKNQMDQLAIADSEFCHKIQHVNVRAEAIAFKKGAAYELRSLLETIKHNRIYQQLVVSTQSALTFLNTFNSNFTTLVSFALASPSMIAGKLNMTRLFELSNNFAFIVQFLTWKSTCFDELAECEVALGKIEQLEMDLKAWREIQNQNLTISSCAQDGKPALDIEIQGMSVNSPEGASIFSNFHATFPKGKRTLLDGKSGSGKTTALRSMAGLNPYARGKIFGMPEKSVEFIPSEPYFPYNKTLLEAVFYPEPVPSSPAQIEKVHQLMQEMGFEQSKIDELNTVKDWYGSVLSDGQRKRMMIISAIMKKPTVLFMDEATRGIDIPTKIKVEKALREHLPEATIVYTDHNPSESTFYDHRVQIS